MLEINIQIVNLLKEENSVNKYDNKVTVVAVSFFSESIIENLIKSIGSHIRIIIVENSLNLSLKNNIEKKYKNVEVFIPEKNVCTARWN